MVVILHFWARLALVKIEPDTYLSDKMNQPFSQQYIAYMSSTWIQGKLFETSNKNVTSFEEFADDTNVTNGFIFQEALAPTSAFLKIQGTQMTLYLVGLEVHLSFSPLLNSFDRNGDDSWLIFLRTNNAILSWPVAFFGSRLLICLETSGAVREISEMLCTLRKGKPYKSGPYRLTYS